jgi:hypothetical protein
MGAGPKIIIGDRVGGRAADRPGSTKTAPKII